MIFFCKKFHFGLARPGGRKIHTAPVPQLGGVSFYVSVLLPFLFFAYSGKGLALLAGASLVFFLGVLDDLFDLGAGIKLVWQIVAACALIFSGIRIEFLTNPAGGMIPLGFAGIILTALWVVGITNAMNLVDGLDGLAAGLSLISSVLFLLLSFTMKTQIAFLPVLCACVAGSCLGFLFYNFHPAKIFMGDSGAYFLGYLLSAVAILGAFKSAAALALFVPLLVLSIPILDTATSIMRRLLSGQSPAHADQNHLHHKLLQMGLSQRQTVILIYFVSMLLGFLGLFLARGK